MSTKERLMEDLKTAMREHDVVRRDAIRMARAAIGNAEIELQREVTDEEAIKIIAKEVNLRKDAVEMFRRGGRARSGRQRSWPHRCAGSITCPSSCPRTTFAPKPLPSSRSLVRLACRTLGR